MSQSLLPSQIVDDWSLCYVDRELFPLLTLQRLHFIEGLVVDYPRLSTTGPSVMLTEKNAAGCQSEDGLGQPGRGGRIEQVNRVEF